MYRLTDGKNNDYLGTNEIYRALKLDKYFEDISDNDVLLQKLYVNNVGKDGPVEDFEPVLHKVYPDVLKTEGIHTADGSVRIQVAKKIYQRQESQDLDCSYLCDFLKTAYKRNKDSRGRTMPIRHTRASKRLLVVLAGIGEGKTTLLDYFFRIWVRRSKSQQEVIRVNIDFEGKDNIKPSQLTENYLAGIICDKIRDEYPDLLEDKRKLREVLDERIRAQKGLLDLIEEKAGYKARESEELDLMKRFHGNLRILAPSLINYLVNHENKRVVVTLDNVDRLRNTECQYKAVNLVHEALHQWDCCAIVCVREYTYGNLWMMGRWGFQTPLLYHKRPPRFADVLRRKFAKFPVENCVDKPSFEIREKLVTIENVQRFVKNVTKILWSENIEQSLFRINNGDVRQMLEMVKVFLSFQGLDMEGLFTATFLKKSEDVKKIRALNVNFDNFVRAITVANYRYYCLSNPLLPAAQATFVINMIGGPAEMPLLPYRILTYLRKFELARVKPLINKACCLGVTKQNIQDVLESFLQSYLIESLEGVNIRNVKEVVITRKGVYYFDVLTAMGKYVQNMMNDTWWDKIIPPYEQHYSLKEEAKFLRECIEQIYRMEIREQESVKRKFWATYEEFLDRRPYCEKLGGSILSHLKNLRSRKAKVPNDIIRSIAGQLDLIQRAKDERRLAYMGAPRKP